MSWPRHLHRRLIALLPGLMLCGAVTGAAFGAQALETEWAGRAWLEPLVLAILIGAIVRSVWAPGARWTIGVDFCARTLLEVAVLLLGVTISAGAAIAVGAPLLAGVALVVAISLAAGYGLGRLFGLPHHMATLVACGNAICGNSAIAAVAPVIGADRKDVAAAISFTAVLGVVVILGLPLASAAMHMSPRASGVLAGLTVYAVPQVLAATATTGVLAAQVGTIVKLARVLMLGPVVLALSLANRRRPGGGAIGLHRLVPWFILGFLGLATARSLGLIPTILIAPASHAATVLTVISMAALGLGVDVRAVARAGGPVAVTVALSFCGLAAAALLLMRALQIG